MKDYQKYIAKSRYARWIDSSGRREDWDETVGRYLQFFSNKTQLPDSLRTAMINLDVMPSMRAMMTAGQALARDNVAGYNCCFLVVDSPRSFDELMYILMCGTGVGYSVERQFVQKLPEVSEDFTTTNTVIHVADSKTGWAKAFRELLSLLWAGQVPTWDLSKIRPAGARLHTFGGRASGPEPLDSLFKFTVQMFRTAAGRKLTDLECHDLCCKIADIVVVGGVRRSALISLSNLGSDRMRKAKMGQWWDEHPYRALANNSVVYTEKPDFQTFLAEWQSLYESKCGERGIISRPAMEKQVVKYGRREGGYEWGCNPCCVSGETVVLTDRGEYPIESLVGKSVNIWNGEYWARVVPYAAGVAPLWKVALSDGKELFCTANHRWFIEGVGEVVTDELSVGDPLQEFFVPLVMEQDQDWPQEQLYYAQTQCVADVFPTDRTEMTYCFTEPKTSRGTFNGIVTGNSEIILRPNQFCNLSELVIRSTDTKETIRDKAVHAAILGTLQSTLTDFRYLRSSWKKNTEEERLLGVSLTGICDNAFMADYTNPELPVFLEELRELVVETNKEWAAKLGIPASTATTCVKPSGTVSQLVDSASGIHGRFSPYYIRRVRADKKDPLAQAMRDAGIPCEDDKHNPSVYVFSFPQKSPEGSVIASAESAIEQLERWKVYAEHWCEHKPSVTVYYSDDEFLAVGQWVWDNFDSISGISFLPRTDHVYEQAPYEAISKEKYEELSASMPVMDWDKLNQYEQDDMTIGSQELACVGGSCEL